MHIHSLMQNAALFLWIACLTVATPLHEHQIEGLLQPGQQLHQRKRQAGGGSYPVTGVQNAGVAPRLEIRQMQKSPDMFNIFILGLARFQATPQDDPRSYYEISAIHGRPYKDWDNVRPAPGNEQTGYCTHVSNLLLPWHRPYLALFEQVLFEHVLACVDEFPPGEARDRYAQAARSVRLPYWDWAVKPESGGVFPDIVQQPRIDVVMPNGPTTIDNPLFSYKFHTPPGGDLFFDPFASWTETKRAPTGWVSDATSQNNLISPDLDNQQGTFANRIYNLLTFYTNFTQFSNEAWIGDEQNVDSVEALHDTIHGIVGKNGHMTYLDFSSYDYIFWMHHTTLDRFFAIWQSLHPDSYVEPMAAKSPTYTIPIGSIQDANSPLEPFSKDSAGTKWTSNTVRDTAQFGYTYPETQSGNQADTIAAVNKLYGAGYNGGGPVQRRGILSGALSLIGFEVDGRQRHYTASLLSNKHAMNGTYAIYVFVGDFDDSDPCSWPVSPNLAGTQVAFSNLHAPNATAKPSIVMGGTIPLTDILLTKVSTGELASLEENDVHDYLEKNLHWRAARFDDTAVPIEEISDLEIVVTLSEVKPSLLESLLPTRESFKKLTSITQGKKGGWLR